MHRTAEVVLLVRYSINRTHYRIICIARGLMVLLFILGKSARLAGIYAFKIVDI